MKSGEKVVFYRISKSLYSRHSLMGTNHERKLFVGKIGTILTRYGDFHTVKFEKKKNSLTIYIHKEDLKSLIEMKLERICK
jgi:hypothetical protein